MTAIGKMLTFLVLVLSLGWFYLTANAYVARVNWRAEAKRYQEDATKMQAAAEKMNGVILAGRDAANDDRKALLGERDRQAATIKNLTDNQKDLNALYQAAFASGQKQSADTAKLQANIDQLLLEKKNADEKLAKNLADQNAMLLEVGRARAAESTTQLKLRALQAQNESQREQIAKLQTQLEEQRRGGVAGGVAGGGAAPAPEGFRATVTLYDRDRRLVAINEGMDANLVRNAQLKVQRIDKQGGGKYLGTMTITQVDAKEAVGIFTPAPGLRRDPANEPRPSDLVTPLN